MNFKQKLIYMALGCLFTLIGYTLATLNTNGTAQTDEIIDEIVCRKLKVVDKFDNTILIIGHKLDYGKADGGVVFTIYNPVDRRKVIEMGSDWNGMDLLTMYNPRGKKIIQMDTGNDSDLVPGGGSGIGGLITVNHNTGHPAVEMGVRGRDGGWIWIEDADKKNNIMLIAAPKLGTYISK